MGNMLRQVMCPLHQVRRFRDPFLKVRTPSYSLLSYFLLLLYLVSNILSATQASQQSNLQVCGMKFWSQQQRCQAVFCATHAGFLYNVHS